ncbi:MAG TPA: HAMP domain-containing sensor histidine kinase [Polyangiaceae bacterium]
MDSADASKGNDADVRVAEVLQILLSIGHELRNPLSTIETSAYLVSQRLSSQNDASVGKHLEKIRNQVRFASRIVDTLLDVARQKPPKRTHVALRALLESAIDARKVHPNVSVRCALPADFGIFVDPDQIRMIVENLIANANEACAARGSGNVSIVGHVSREDVEIDVIDDGPGVVEGVRSRIFELAFTTKQGGHGLGLALCRRLAENHGGTLTLEPSSIGAVFRLHIPGAIRNDAERSG